MAHKKNGKKLKSGFTTGTAAAAATKGALLMLLDGSVPESVVIMLLTGDPIRIPMHTCTRIDHERVRCSVIKDAGDDPDVTHRAEIGATVRFMEKAGATSVSITGGRGVGTVTKPGLDTPPGNPAITRGPRKMIVRAVEDVLGDHDTRGLVATEIDVPEGVNLAKNTLNARLGILGGISILGTTGIVRPLSHDAYIATIDAALSVAKAAGVGEVVLTTGRRSERFSQNRWQQRPEEAFVQIGDFFKMSMERVAGLGFGGAAITVFFGKAVKMAQGIPHTHAAKSRMTLEKLAQWAFETTGNRRLADRIGAANTARHALSFILPDYPRVVTCVGERMIRSAENFAGPAVRVRGVIYDFEGDVIFDNNHRSTSAYAGGTLSV